MTENLTSPAHSVTKYSEKRCIKAWTEGAFACVHINIPHALASCSGAAAYILSIKAVKRGFTV